MAKQSEHAPEHDDDAGSGYEAPTELSDEDLRRDEEELSEAGAPRDEGPPAPRTGALKLAIGLAVVIGVAASVLVYRVHHRRSVLDAGLAEAARLLGLDTAAGYREAASKLEPLGAMDPLVAASVRAFALGMLFADYRDAAAEKEAEALLVEPFRAREVPPEASLAAGALALGRREAGSALTHALRAGDGASALALQARVALQAGNADAASDAARGAAEAGLPAGLALHGDVLRRARRDAAAAKTAYEAALAASPLQPRAAYGLAKLAHAGKIQPALAAPPLERLVADGDGTPAPERARAALHLAALRLRADDPSVARAALDAGGLEPKGRAWAERAAAVLAGQRGTYRAVSGAPASVQSASDDDPAVLAPNPPAPPKPAVAPAKPAPPTAAKRAVAPARRTTAVKPATRTRAKPPATRTTATRKTTSTTRR